MSTITNQATLSYNNVVTNSNVVTATVLDPLGASKTAVGAVYGPNDNITYIINVTNTSSITYSNLTISDNLGSYLLGASTIVPLSYVGGSALYYINGVPQTAPLTVNPGPPLVFSGITLTAGSNLIVVFQASVNEYAPLATGSQITNTAQITANNVTTPITVTETVLAQAAPMLSITKTMSPLSISDNEPVTYSFIIQNTGNTAITAADNVIVGDVFDPPISITGVTFNSADWVLNTNYSYNPSTGVFASLANQITVGAATYVQNPTTGVFTVSPGVSILNVTGTII